MATIQSTDREEPKKWAWAEILFGRAGGENIAAIEIGKEADKKSHMRGLTYRLEVGTGKAALYCHSYRNGLGWFSDGGKRFSVTVEGDTS